LLEKNDVGWSFWPWKKIGDGNNPRSVIPPSGWSALTGYAKTRTGLSPERGEIILKAFLENCRLERCVRYPAVLKTMFPKT